MINPRRLLYLIPICAFGAGVVLAALSLMRGQEASRQLQPGFLFSPSGAVSVMQVGPWPKSQLNPGDRVVAVDGQAVADGLSLRRRLDQRDNGDWVDLTLRRRWDDGTYRLRLQLRPLGARQIAAGFALPYGIGVTYLLLGAVIFFIKRTYEAGLVMSMCVLASVFYMTTFDAHTSYQFSRLWLTYPLLGPVSLHLFAAFPVRRPRIHRPAVLAVPYLLSCLVIASMQASLHHASYTWVSVLSGSFVTACFLADLALLSVSAARHESEVVRNKARTLRVGLLVFIAGGVVWSLVMARIYPEMLTAERVLLLSALFPVLLAYAAIKKDLFDLDLFLRTTTIYAVATALVAALYVALVLISSVALQAWGRRYAGVMQSVEAVAITLVVALIFHPLRRGVQRVVDRVFFREQGALLRSVARLSDDLARSEQLPEVGEKLTSQLVQLMRCGFAGLLGPIPGQRDFGVVAISGNADLAGIDASPEALEQLAGQRPQSLEEVTNSGAAGRLLAERLRAAKVSMVVPLRVSNTLTGMLFLGPRRQGDYYTRADRAALRSLSSPAALAVRNGVLLREHAARERLATLGQMAAMIVHEIKNPLGIIKVSSGTLRRRFTPEETGHELASFIEAEVDRMNRTVAQFLTFARPQRPQVAPCDLSALVRRTVGAARGDLEQAGIGVDLDSGDEVMVEADPDQLQQVLLNLLNNAKQALAESVDGLVSVRVGPVDEREVELSVSNNGPPIQPEMLQRIFEPFFTTRFGGTGLGLAIARQVLHEQRGRISARTLSDGTAFTVTLPRWTKSP